MPQANAKLNAFPVFMRVEGKAVAIVGGGEEALAKARLIGQSSAVLRIIAENAEPDLLTFIAQNNLTRVAVSYDASHLEGVVLVFAASGDEALDRRVAADAHRLGIPVNAVDRPELCDFFTPALVNRAPVAIAIGTEGAGPVLAQMLRARIDQMLSPSLGSLAVLAASFRSAAEKLLPKGNVRRRFWSGFFQGAPARAVEAGELSQAHDAATDLLLSNAPASGHIALVGAGPGAEDLLTLRAHRLLTEADVIVHDALVPEAIVAMGRRDAERLPVGKRKGCSVAAETKLTLSGRTARRSVGTATRSAQPAWSTNAATRAPTAGPEPSAAACSTTPTMSWPGTQPFGRMASRRSSPRFNEVARTEISASL